MPGLLYLLALTSMGVYGVIIAGWASNSKYAFLGAMRSAAQMVAYEIAMGFALVGVLMATGSMNLGTIVRPRRAASLAGTGSGCSRCSWSTSSPGWPRPTARRSTWRKGESEIVAGFHVEYSGMAFALFFLAEYANMILISFLTAVFFFGGWLGPFEGYPLGLGATFLGQPSFLWLFIKVFVFVFLFLWFRATFPRYRYDQIMRLGWKVLIPVTLVWIVVEMLLAVYRIGPWARPGITDGSNRCGAILSRPCCCPSSSRACG